MFKPPQPKPHSYKQLFVILICLLPFLYFIYPRNEGKTILILGDSLSSPYGIGPQDSWVFLLQERVHNKKLPFRVVNSSTPGDTTNDGLRRLSRVLKNTRPTLTIIGLGSNDALKSKPISEIRKNLLTLIQLAKQANSKVLLLGMNMAAIAPNDSEYANEFHQIYPELAQQEHIYLVPHFLRGVEDQPYLMQDDKLHPVKEAQPIILDNVWPQIQEILVSVQKKVSSRSY